LAKCTRRHHDQAALSIAPTNYFKGWSGIFMAAAMVRLEQEQSALGILEQAVGYAEQAGHISRFAVALLRGEARACGVSSTKPGKR
jgi:hypothetical protein